jgi:hypothetical protein
MSNNYLWGEKSRITLFIISPHYITPCQERYKWQRPFSIQMWLFSISRLTFGIQAQRATLPVSSPLATSDNTSPSSWSGSMIFHVAERKHPERSCWSSPGLPYGTSDSHGDQMSCLVEGSAASHPDRPHWQPAAPTLKHFVAEGNCPTVSWFARVAKKAFSRWKGPR